MTFETALLGFRGRQETVDAVTGAAIGRGLRGAGQYKSSVSALGESAELGAVALAAYAGNTICRRRTAGPIRCRVLQMPGTGLVAGDAAETFRGMGM